MITAPAVLAALALDWALGEPRRRHPLAGFGILAQAVEHRLRGGPGTPPRARRRRGALAVLVLVAPPVLAAALLARRPWAGPVADVLLLYLALGHRSLHDHARAVIRALEAREAGRARRLAGRMVSRDPAVLDVPAAVTESVLENGNDAVFATLFWFTLAGGAGAVLHRLVNTLDAMWGHRDARYRDFGRAAARLDDALNFIPARLTALTYACLGHTRTALRCWRHQAPAWDSPNAGPVMAAGAGALGLVLGGPARYRGCWRRRPRLGTGARPDGRGIERALGLVRRGVWLWVGVLAAAGALGHAG